MKPWFKDWFNSPYYHLLYSDRNEQEAADFIDKLLIYLQPFPESRMLDVACGKGRHSLQLAAKGFDVTGIDLSEASILEALASESDRLHFYVHDMRKTFWINYFDYAFNFFTSFGYFDTLREHENALRSMAGSLKSKGLFVIDYLNIHVAEKEMVPLNEKKIGNVSFEISKRSDETHILKEIVVNDDDLNEKIYFNERVARFAKDDLIKMLTAQDLIIKEIFGDYNLSPFDIEKSPRLILVAEKK